MIRLPSEPRDDPRSFWPLDVKLPYPLAFHRAKLMWRILRIRQLKKRGPLSRDLAAVLLGFPRTRFCRQVTQSVEILSLAGYPVGVAAGKGGGIYIAETPMSFASFRTSWCDRNSIRLCDVSVRLPRRLVRGPGRSNLESETQRRRPSVLRSPTRRADPVAAVVVPVVPRACVVVA